MRGECPCGVRFCVSLTFDDPPKSPTPEWIAIKNILQTFDANPGIKDAIRAIRERRRAIADHYEAREGQEIQRHPPEYMGLHQGASNSNLDPVAPESP